MDINLIGVPLKYGSGKDGAQLGPAKLREYELINALSVNENKVYDLGDLYVPIHSEDDKFQWHDKMKFLKPVLDVNTSLAHTVYCSLTGNSFPLVIGGDHSLGLGSIAGGSKFFKEMAVIWVDAHGDINNSETSPSGNIHGMPLAASMGVGHSDLTNLYFSGQKVKPQNVYILGARDLDPGEVALAEELKLNLYTMETVREKGLDLILNQIIENIKSSKVDGVHLSFDIDALDSSLVPGTGTRVSEGFSLNEGKLILKDILVSGFVTSMDFVELNPVLDDENESTANVCLELIKDFSKYLKK
jgi:arginase